MRVPVFRDAFRDLNRLRQIAAVVVRHGFGEFLDRSRAWESLGKKVEVPADPAVASKATAARFRDMLAELGPTFVKLGQVLSTRPDLLPATWVEELRSLQDRVPPVGIESIRAEIEASLGRPVAASFSWIEEKPLASASIAQVHRARTASGELVVVKVQRPAIEEKIRSDVAILYYFAQLLEAVVEETGLYGPVGIVEEFERSLSEELDFVHEAENVRAFWERAAERPGLRVPQVHDELSGRRVLTLEYLEGPKITEACPPHEPKKLARTLIESGFRLLFEEGIFHGDPHPGNLLVLEDGRIGVLDFGLVGRLTPQMQETIVLLVIAVALRDADSAARLIYRVGLPDQRTNLAAFRADIDGILRRYLGRSLKEVPSAQVMRELLDLTVRYHIRIPKDYALLAKAVMTTEGIVRALDPELDLLTFGVPYARELLQGRFDPAALLGMGTPMKSMLRLSTVLQDVPTQLSQILLDLEGGKFTVQARSPEVQRIEGAIRGMGVTVFLGLIASALVIGAFFSLARIDWLVGGRIPFAVIVAAVGLLGAGALFWAALSWSAMQGRFRKIRLSRWLGRGRGRIGRR